MSTYDLKRLEVAIKYIRRISHMHVPFQIHQMVSAASPNLLESICPFIRIMVL